ncbi:MAG: hypothetical protein AAGF20_13070, partial [Pseudomonadota bacterium]
MTAHAGTYTLIALHERDIGLLEHPSTAGLGPFILVVDTDDLRPIMLRYGNHPRIAQILRMAHPGAPAHQDGRTLQALIEKGHIVSPEVWIDKPALPSRHNGDFVSPGLMLAYPAYRLLRHLGFSNITLRAQNWQHRVAPFPLLETFANRHAGERCFIMGNGPSLNAIEMTRLKDEVTFGSNRVFLGYPKWGFECTYWGVEDRLQIEVYGDDYAEGVPSSTQKFVPFDYVSFTDLPNTAYFPLLYGNGRNFPGCGVSYPAFSARPDVTFHGFTITYSLIELAALMGFSEIYLIGVDHSYGLGATKLSNTVSGGDASTWQASDASAPTHFDESYTDQNKQFIKPRPVNAEIAYACARQWHDVHG